MKNLTQSLCKIYTSACKIFNVHKFGKNAQFKQILRKISNLKTVFIFRISHKYLCNSFRVGIEKANVHFVFTANIDFLYSELHYLRMTFLTNACD